VNVLRSTVTGICNSEKAYAATQALHPFVLEDADQEEVATMRDLWGDALPLAVADLSALQGGPEINADELLRVSITLQHNAYGSGFYQMFSLVNHTCAPNCTKLYPSTDKGWRKASEIWTTRDLKQGDELTICYNHIREMTDSSIAQFLHAHHRFQCNCPIHPVESTSSSPSDITIVPIGESETLSEEATLVVDDWSSVLQERVEYYEEQLERFTGENSKKTKDLEVLFDIITVCEEILADIVEYTSNSLSPDQFVTLKNVSNGFITVKDNQLVKPDVYFNTSELIGVKERDGIYMTVRLHKIIVSAASVSIQELGTLESTLLSKKKSDKAFKTFTQLKWAAQQYLTHALEVAPLQLYYLGAVHPDIAQTFLDIAEGISCAFSLDTEAAKYAEAGMTGLIMTGSSTQPREQEEDKEDKEETEEYGGVNMHVVEASMFQRLHTVSPERYGWAKSTKSAQQMMDKIRKEGERIANLYRPRYDLVQERLVTMSLEMPDAY
jgi:hypothetical protein